VQLAGSVKDSAQQIWLAGMGAFSKAQAEGGKVFEALVKEGMNLQKKTQGMAEEKISEVTGKMSAMAGNVTSKAGQNWDKLESIFEQRVAKALNTLGVPTAKDVDALIKRVDDAGRRGGRLARVRPRRRPKAGEGRPEDRGQAAAKVAPNGGARPALKPGRADRAQSGRRAPFFAPAGLTP
jgi:poly(hydroxyalkanoate) granule-associated protein